MSKIDPGGGNSGRPTEWWPLGLDSDPVPQDGSNLETMAYRYHAFADDVDHSWRGAVTLVNDPAITTWMGKSGDAFRAAAGPFPDMLDGAAKAYRDVGDAFATFSGKIADIQGRIDLLATASLYDAEEMQLDSGLSENAVRTLVTIPYRPELETRLDDYASTSTLSPDAYKASYDKIAESWLAIGNRRGDLQSLLSDLREAKRIWMNAVESATDSAHDIAAQLGGTGKNSGDFNVRFAAFGGTVADLVLDPLAGIDLDVAQLPLPGTDPNEIASWWTSLPQAERDKLLLEHPDIIGSLDGIPCLDRDKANRVLLISTRKAYEDRIAYLLAHIPPTDGRDYPNPEFDKWNTELDRLRDQQSGLDAIYDRLYYHPDQPPAFLLELNTTNLGHAIIAINNPDTATNVVTYVPGTGSKLGKIGGDIARSDAMVAAALNYEARGQTTSSITWIDYDAPQNIAKDSPFTHYAYDAELKLLNFETGLRTTHQGVQSLNTIIGHSYGSTTVGFTMRDLGLPVDRAIFVGSPGVGVEHASQLHIDPSDVYVGAADNDPVANLPLSEDLPELPSNALNMLGWSKGWTHYDVHGPFGQLPYNPEFGAHVFQVAPGSAWPPGAAHSQYWDKDSTSLDNIGRIVSGSDPQ